jgi:hypothetical protein
MQEARQPFGLVPSLRNALHETSHDNEQGLPFLYLKHDKKLNLKKPDHIFLKVVKKSHPQYTSYCAQNIFILVIANGDE